MKKQNHSEKKDKERISFLSALFHKAERDATYKTDLIHQWSQMNNFQRIHFIIGGAVGLIVFFGALILVFFLLFRLFG
ncbi:MAG: hypothetical protein SVT56_14065 [Chloroflexota bacterium]|jgi:hypothetical protein|nr:hypothetical protein [Chloroflexota bacterium]